MAAALLAVALLLSAAGPGPGPAPAAAGSPDVTPKEFVLVSGTEALLGGVARLPCDLTPPQSEDQVWAVIWYREGNSKPCYSYDARLRTESKAGTHWSDEKAFGGQVTFRENESPAHLTIENVRESDAGAYRCRVDFKRSQTRNARVNLTVIVPPKKLQIVDQSGAEMKDGVLGPFNEGESINVTCIAVGGWPTPRVTWWLENALVDDSSEHVTDGKVQNVLRLERLERKQLHSVYTCQAANNQLAAPVSTAVSLDLKLKVLKVQIRNASRPLRADRQHQLACEVTGSRPAPIITWWKGSQELDKTRTVLSADNQSVISYLTFIPSKDDFNISLFCRGETPDLSGSAKEVSVRLNVTHIPVVTVTLSAPSVDEGAGVALECNVRANPPPTRVVWRHNGIVVNSSWPGVQLNNHSLMLQSVQRSSAGSYVCTATNSVGDGISSTASLEVRFRPVCRGQQPVKHARPGATIEVQCPVISFHQDHVTYRWAREGAGGQRRGKASANANPHKDNAIPRATTGPQGHGQGQQQRDEEQDPLSSHNGTIRYKVHEFGTLLCWAKGDLGEMQHPCSIKITAEAGKPDPPSDCSLSQPTSRSVTLACTAAGYPGALPRHYVVEAYDALDGSLLRNVTNTTTHWLVDGLPPARNVTLLLYAANAKGRSAELRVLATTLQAPQPRTGATAGASRASMPLAGLLVPLLGTVSGLVVLAAVIVAILRLRGRGEGNDEKAGGRRRGAGGGSTAAGGGGGGAVSAEGGLRGVGEFSQDGGDRDSQQDNSKEDLIQRDEKDPDVIPYKTDLDYLDEDEKAFQYLHQTSTLRMRPSHGSAMGMGPGLGPGLAPSIQPLLASNLHADQSPGGLGRGLGQCGQQGLQSLQPNYQPDYQPEYQPDYQYQTGYQPVLQPVPVLQANGKPAMQPGPGMHTQVQGFGTLRRNPHHLHHLPHPVVEVTPPQPLLSQEVPPPRIYRDTKF